jgi:RNA polymerase primary sigma factor
VRKRAQVGGEAIAYAGLGHPIPSRSDGDKLLREMTQAREQSAGGDPLARGRFERLRNRVCASHMRFALVLCNRFVRRRGRLDLEDLLQHAALGLMRACETFEPDRGLAFSTYSAHWVGHYVGRGIVNDGRIIRVPSYVQDARARCGRAASKFVAAMGRVPNVEELSKLMGRSLEATARAWTRYDEVLSLDAPASDEHSAAIGYTVPSNDPTPLDALLMKERADHLRTSFAALPDREREVVERRAVDGEMSLKEIGATLAKERTGRRGLSRERVRQTERAALRTLRRRAEKGLRLDS